MGKPSNPFGKKDKFGGDYRKRELELQGATQRAEGIAAKNLGGDIAGNTDISVRQKLSLLSVLRRDKATVNVDSLSDEEAATNLSKLQLADPFYAVSDKDQAFANVRERFRELVTRSQESSARFAKEKEIRADLPGQSQIRASTLLGGRK
jgi:hypothetical protein